MINIFAECWKLFCFTPSLTNEPVFVFSANWTLLSNHHWMTLLFSLTWLYFAKSSLKLNNSITFFQCPFRFSPNQKSILSAHPPSSWFWLYFWVPQGSMWLKVLIIPLRQRSKDAGNPIISRVRSPASFDLCFSSSRRITSGPQSVYFVTAHAYNCAFALSRAAMHVFSAQLRQVGSSCFCLLLCLKGLAMIFAGQENPFIIFRSKDIYINFKTNNKIPINLLK